MSATPYSRFNPAQLWYSAREEILFGGGAYLMRTDDEHQARVIAKRWTSFLLDHPQGLAFEVEQDGARIIVTLSSIGHNTIVLCGYGHCDLQIVGMRTAGKAEFLRHFEKTLTGTL